MLPELRPAERAVLYGVVGGIPMYLAWWDQAAPLAENLRALACEPGARLLTVALAGRARTPILTGEAKWAREVSAPRIVADLHHKTAALPGAPHDLRIAICARERVINLPDDVIAITADDIYS